MTNLEIYKLYERYVRGWAAVSSDERAKIVEEVLAPDIKYTTPQHETGGRQRITDDMIEFQAKYPGGRFDVGDISAHHDSALLVWIFVGPDGEIKARGHDAVRISARGQFASITTFAPAAPAA